MQPILGQLILYALSLKRAQVLVQLRGLLLQIH